MALSLLVLTDFTQPADHALAYADRLAGAVGARLVLLHVRRDAILDPEQLSGTLAGLDTEAIRLAFASLERGLTAPAVAEAGHGLVAEAVARAVRQHQPTLIVLGRTEAGNTPDELLTPLALALLRTIPHPLLVVPESPATPPAPRRVLLAVDGEPFTLGPYTGAVRRLLDALPAALTVLHVLPPGSAEELPRQALESVQRTGLADDLTELTRHRRVSAPHPAEGILRVAGSAEFDLVALIARPRSFLGRLFHHSVTAQVLLHSPIPVLMLPAME
ncbi:universal stress protein [Hymenobacter terricola]|uniref:universal stress protein n=1 Tax=Hymenobacter terricola TaxID=2819236 RepID=UPI001B3029BE|nr:universal stress protein [Hymenobacter terricola]